MQQYDLEGMLAFTVQVGHPDYLLNLITVLCVPYVRFMALKKSSPDFSSSVIQQFMKHRGFSGSVFFFKR